jgi:hypothetical protein
MKTDAERLQLALDFVNGPDPEDHGSVMQLRHDLAIFLSYPLLEDDQIVPDLEDRWSDTIGGTSYEVTAKIELAVSRVLHIDMRELSVSKGASRREGLADFIGFGPESVAVPVKVLRQLQNRTRQLIHDYLGYREADERRHATWVERGPGTKERRADGKDTVFHVNELAEQLGGTIKVVGRGAGLRTHITAEPEAAFLWIVLLLINGEPSIRVCQKPDCSHFFVGARRSKRYCSERCGQSVRDARRYAKPEKRAKKIRYMREKRAREKVATGS